LKKYFSEPPTTKPDFGPPGALALTWSKARASAASTVARVIEDRNCAAKFRKRPANHALGVRFCSKNRFPKILKAVVQAGLARQYTVLPRDGDLGKACRMVSGVVRVIDADAAAWLEGMRARLGSYDLVLFLLDNAHQVSTRVALLRKSLAPVPVLGLDGGWAAYALDPHAAGTTP